MMPRTIVASLAAAGLLITCGLSPASAQGRTLKDRFVGTWKLVSIETRNAKGEVVRRPPARTRIIRLYRLRRRRLHGGDDYAAWAEENAGAADRRGSTSALAGYTGYFGTFTINEKER
jgi:hypothetical protein